MNRYRRPFELNLSNSQGVVEAFLDEEPLLLEGSYSLPLFAMSGSRPGRELHAGDLAPLVICPFCPLSTTNYGPIRSSG
jgi:hypothetical protein